jgi:hypothetical protein
VSLSGILYFICSKTSIPSDFMWHNVLHAIIYVAPCSVRCRHPRTAPSSACGAVFRTRPRLITAHFCTLSHPACRRLTWHRADIFFYMPSFFLTRRRRHTYFRVLVSGFSGEKVRSAISVGYFSLKQRENFPTD